MSPYLAILPNSPLLLHAFEESQFLETKKSFQKVRDELRKRSINHIITISNSPRFERTNFSVYVHPEYELQFADFGDLVTKSKVPIWWEGYNAIQEQITSTTIDLIDHPTIDFGHAVPIHLLEQLKHPTEQFQYLCFNSLSNATEEQQYQLGEQLLQALNARKKDYAILLFGSLYQTKSAHLAKATQVKNTTLREELLSGDFSFSQQPADQDLLPPSLTQSIHIAKPFLQSTAQLKELSFEKHERTSFFAADNA